MPNPLLLNGILESAKTGRLYSLAGSYDALASVTVPSGGLASITFAGIPTGYTHLQVRALVRDNSGTGGLAFLRATANGDTTSGNYYGHYLYGSGASATASATAGTSNGLICGFVANNSETAGIFSTSIIDILDYANINKNKTFRSLTGGDFNNSDGGVALISGLWMNQISPITSLTFTADAGTGFIQYSSFALYGVK